VDDTYFTVYSPMYASMTRAPYNFSKGVGSLSNFTWDAAFWVFNFVSNFSYPRFSIVIDDVKRVQNELEGKFLAQQKNVEETALSLLKNSRGEAIDFLTNHSVQSAEKTYQRWKKFGEELLLKNIDGVAKTEFYQPKNIGYPDHFKKLMIEEAGMQIKVKELVTDKELAFKQHLHKAELLLEKRNYQEAKTHFLKALEMKPDNNDLKAKIDQIRAVLATIEELHNSTFLE